ncbi:MAG: ATP-binding cassette domain-containing protein, partial [Planctomycetota bacterium]
MSRGREPVLRVEHLTRHFGGVRALQDVGVEAYAGEVVGIIGPNGSGKTTLINCVTGFVKPSAGKVLFRGRDITGMAPHRIADMGVARTFQIMRPYRSLPAFKNLVVALSSPRARRQGSGRHGDRDTVAVDILEDLGFERDSRVPFRT